MRRRVAELTVVLEDDQLAHGHLAAPGGAVVLKHIEDRVPEQRQILLRKAGALAGSVSHDSHNLIVIGTNEEEMAFAANYIKKIGGGLAVVKDKEVLAKVKLPVAGLMSAESAEKIAEDNRILREKANELGINEGIEPFMNMAFVSLPVIPSLKMTTQGLVDVDNFKRVGLFVD